MNKYSRKDWYPAEPHKFCLANSIFAPATKIKCRVAQLVERLIVNQMVGGSSPFPTANITEGSSVGRVLDLESRCRKFESCPSDQIVMRLSYSGNMSGFQPEDESSILSRRTRKAVVSATIVSVA